MAIWPLKLRLTLLYINPILDTELHVYNFSQWKLHLNCTTYSFTTASFNDIPGIYDWKKKLNLQIALVPLGIQWENFSEYYICALILHWKASQCSCQLFKYSPQPTLTEWINWCHKVANFYFAALKTPCWIWLFLAQILILKL